VSANARAALAIARKDLAIWLRRPVAIFTTVTPSLLYVLVVYYVSVAVGTPPIAVVTGARGAPTQRLVGALRDSGGFKAEVVGARQARSDLHDLSVAGIVWLPAALDRDVAAHDQVAVRAEFNNLNADIVGDLRRSLALSVRDFSAASGATPVVRVTEHDTHAAGVSLAEFRMIPGLVLILTIVGIVNAALATCQEFEQGTFDELALAPVPTSGIVVGKVLGGWLTTVFVGACMWVAGVGAGLLHPHGPYWLAGISMSLLVGLAAASIGVTIGALLRQFQLASSTSIVVSLYLFFLAGGVSVLAFLPVWLQDVTRFDPLYYAIQSLQRASLDGSAHDFLRDALIMTSLAIAGTILAVWAVSHRSHEPRSRRRPTLRSRRADPPITNRRPSLPTRS